MNTKDPMHVINGAGLRPDVIAARRDSSRTLLAPPACAKPLQGCQKVVDAAETGNRCGGTLAAAMLHARAAWSSWSFAAPPSTT